MQMELVHDRTAKIKVIGVGGAGGNAVNRMVSSGFDGVEFISINTDALALENSLADKKIHIGKTSTKGLGAGANPSKAHDSILEDRQEVVDALVGADMVFIAAGMGGGTGTGAAPVVAEICKELDILSVAVVTKPFPFEGPVRSKNCKGGIEAINNNIDTLISIANEKILGIVDRKMNFKDAFAFCDGVLTDAVRSISEIILKHGEVQVDFADVKAIMQNGGQALMGTGYAEGEDRATEAAQKAITSPLLDDVDINGATGVLVHISANEDLGMHEVSDAMNFIYEAVGEETAANVIFGVSEKPEMTDGISVTVIATGFGGDKANEAQLPDNFATPVQQTAPIEPTVVPAAQPQVMQQVQQPVAQPQMTQPQMTQPVQQVVQPQATQPQMVQPAQPQAFQASQPQMTQPVQPLANYVAPEVEANVGIQERPSIATEESLVGEEDIFDTSVEEQQRIEEELNVPSYKRMEQEAVQAPVEEQIFSSSRQTSDYLNSQVEGEEVVEQPAVDNASSQAHLESYNSQDDDDYEVPAFLRNLNL